MTRLSRRRLLRGIGLTSLGVMATTRGTRTAMAASDWGDTTLRYSSDGSGIPSFTISETDIDFSFSWSNFPDVETDVSLTLYAGLPTEGVDYESVLSGTFSVKSPTGQGERVTGADLVLASGDFPIDILSQTSISSTHSVVPDEETEKTTPVDFKLEFTYDGETVASETTCTVVVEDSTSVPSSALYRWKLGEGSGSVVADSLNGQDGAVNGATWTTGVWQGDAALSGDGSSDVTTSKLSSFASQLDSNLAIAFTVQTTDSGFLGGSQTTADDPESISTTFGVGTYESPGGDELTLTIRDDAKNRNSVYSDAGFADGQKYRVVWNKTGNTASDIQLFVNTTKEPISVQNDEVIASPRQEYLYDFAFFGRNLNGVTDHINATLDDIVFYSDSLTSSGIQSDYDAQPWS